MSTISVATSTILPMTINSSTPPSASPSLFARPTSTAPKPSSLSLRYTVSLDSSATPTRSAASTFPLPEASSWAAMRPTPRPTPTAAYGIRKTSVTRCTLASAINWSTACGLPSEASTVPDCLCNLTPPNRTQSLTPSSNTDRPLLIASTSPTIASNRHCHSTYQPASSFGKRTRGPCASLPTS